MKLRVLNILACLFVTACMITSCLGDDTIEYEFSSNASITSFSITDSIVTYYPGKTDAGTDTTLSFAVLGSEYPFVIDQLAGRIYNPDSLPVGTDVSKVVVGITADTQGIYLTSEKDTLWSEADSLNFETPLHFKVIAESGVFGRIYTAQINVHQQDPELMTWQKLSSNFSTDIREQKAVYANGRIHVFAEQKAQVAVTSMSTSDASQWTTPEAIDIPSKADYTSVMAWNDQLYILASNELYVSSNGLNWTKVETTQKLARLLANIHTEYNHKMIAEDLEGRYVESEDGIQWTCHEALPEGFPKGKSAFVAYPLETNSKMGRIVLLGDNQVKTDSTNVVWTQLDSDKEWAELYPTNEAIACPKLENAALIHYNNRMYTFGGPCSGKNTTNAFDNLYESVDNGITWQTTSEKVAFPEEFTALYDDADGNWSYAIDDNHFIWIMWSRTGEVWKGRINKLGFEKQ